MYEHIDESNLSDIGQKVKNQPKSFVLIYNYCPIMFNISSKYNDFDFNSYRKTNLSKIFPYPCIRKQI